TGGDEKPRPGVDNWRQPVGQTVNAVSGLPAGRAKRVNPPLTAIFKEELVRKYGLFFRVLHTPGGREALTWGREQATASRTERDRRERAARRESDARQTSPHRQTERRARAKV